MQSRITTPEKHMDAGTSSNVASFLTHKNEEEDEWMQCGDAFAYALQLDVCFARSHHCLNGAHKLLFKVIRAISVPRLLAVRARSSPRNGGWWYNYAIKSLANVPIWCRPAWQSLMANFIIMSNRCVFLAFCVDFFCTIASRLPHSSRRRCAMSLRYSLFLTAPNKPFYRPAKSGLALRRNELIVVLIGRLRPKFYAFSHIIIFRIDAP